MRAPARGLYAVCDRQERPAEARAYDSPVGSGSGIARFAPEDRGEGQALIGGSQRIRGSDTRRQKGRPVAAMSRARSVVSR